MVREAIGSALPVRRKKTERPRWKLAGAAAFVGEILELDRKAPRKQRHEGAKVVGRYDPLSQKIDWVVGISGAGDFAWTEKVGIAVDGLNRTSPAIQWHLSHR